MDKVSWGSCALATVLAGIGMGWGSVNVRGGLGDLYLTSPDSSLPFGMTVRGVGWRWSYVRGLKIRGPPPAAGDGFRLGGRDDGR